MSCLCGEVRWVEWNGVRNWDAVINPLNGTIHENIFALLYSLI